jgi:hypothetical protein
MELMMMKLLNRSLAIVGLSQIIVIENALINDIKTSVDLFSEGKKNRNYLSHLFLVTEEKYEDKIL